MPTGRYNDNVTYALPNNATPGTYTVTSRVMSSYGTSQQDAYFYRAITASTQEEPGRFRLERRRYSRLLRSARRS